MTKHVFDLKNTRKSFFLYIPQTKFFKNKKQKGCLVDEF